MEERIIFSFLLYDKKTDICLRLWVYPEFCVNKHLFL